MNQNVPGFQITLELQISSPRFISCPGWSRAEAQPQAGGVLLVENRELPGNSLSQPSNRSRRVKTGEKNLNALPFPIWQAQPTLGDRRCDYQRYFLAQRLIRSIDSQVTLLLHSLSLKAAKRAS